LTLYMKKSEIVTYHATREFFRKIQSNRKIAYINQTISEEVFNTATHGLGTILSIVGFFYLVFFSIMDGASVRLITSIVYGLSLSFMYIASMLYHGASTYRRKKFFHILDHSAIFILIAGTNTPILLVYMKDQWGLELCWASWILATTGVFLEFYFSQRIPKYISITLYTLMGWMILFAAKPMFENLPSGLLQSLFFGGVAYMAGIFFYVRKTLFFNHVIWHLCVLTGSAFHFIGILKYVAMN